MEFGPEKIRHLRRSCHSGTKGVVINFLMQRIILRPSRPILTRLHARTIRPYVSTPVPTPKPTPGPSKPYQHEKESTREPSWLTRKLKQSPTAMRAFLKVFSALGYGSSKQIAARRALALYEQLCSGRADEDSAFWAEGMCAIPPFLLLI
jgi:cytochrome b pre-mRNA-processing protein 3